jgi:hypothetical protein
MSKGYLLADKEVREKITRRLETLRNSCLEGLDGTWDCSTDEGKEGFQAMADSADEIAQMLGIKLPERK